MPNLYSLNDNVDQIIHLHILLLGLTDAVNIPQIWQIFRLFEHASMAILYENTGETVLHTNDVTTIILI